MSDVDFKNLKEALLEDFKLLQSDEKYHQLVRYYKRTGTPMFFDVTSMEMIGENVIFTTKLGQKIEHYLEIVAYHRIVWGVVVVNGKNKVIGSESNHDDFVISTEDQGELSELMLLQDIALGE